MALDSVDRNNRAADPFENVFGVSFDQLDICSPFLIQKTLFISETPHSRSQETLLYFEFGVHVTGLEGLFIDGVDVLFLPKHKSLFACHQSKKSEINFDFNFPLTNPK